MTTAAAPGLALRLEIDGAPASLPTDRVRQVVGYATLQGVRDDYFLGWLRFRGEDVPVFDLHQVLCEQPAKENFGSRIILVETGERTGLIGLLAPGVTDTVAPNEPGVTPLDWNNFLPMLLPLIPPRPECA
jgi:chemotaxis signal transduction protein